MWVILTKIKFVRYTSIIMQLTFFSILLNNYVVWHYKEAPEAIFHIWLNILQYIKHIFAIKNHLFSLFAPWHRMTEKRTKKWDLEEFAGALLINGISRFLGFFMRIVLIASGLVAMAFFVIGLVFLYLLWYFAPIAILGSIVVGLALLLSSFSYGNT